MGTTLMAYMRQVVRCLASCTTPKDPEPRVVSLMIWNSRMDLKHLLWGSPIMEILFKLYTFVFQIILSTTDLECQISSTNYHLSC